MPKARGSLFVFEGPDGIGKSELTSRVTEHLSRNGKTVMAMSFPGREPHSLGTLVYDIHHDAHKFGIQDIDPTSLQLLHVAAHIDTIEQRIRPALNAGTSVVLDRFWWSTLVYGRILGASADSLNLIVEAEKHHWKDIRPTVIFLVSRATPARPGESLERHLQLQHTYRQVASQNNRDSRIVEISTDVTVEESFAHVLAELALAEY